MHYLTDLILYSGVSTNNQGFFHEDKLFLLVFNEMTKVQMVLVGGVNILQYFFKFLPNNTQELSLPD